MWVAISVLILVGVVYFLYNPNVRNIRKIQALLNKDRTVCDVISELQDWKIEHFSLGEALEIAINPGFRIPMYKLYITYKDRKPTSEEIEKLHWELTNENSIVTKAHKMDMPVEDYIQHTKRTILPNETDMFKRPFSKSTSNDISNNYRWSILFYKEDNLLYEMLGDNVVRMLGYLMIPFGRSNNIGSGWRLVLRQNESKKTIRLTKQYFPNEHIIERGLYSIIEEIDPGYQVAFFKDTICIDRTTGAPVKIKTTQELGDYAKMAIEAIKSGTYDEFKKQEESEITLFKILNDIF